MGRERDEGTVNAGFPGGADDLAEMFGVTAADREAWDKQREAHAKAKAQRARPVQNAMRAAFSMAENGITSQMRAAYIEEARGTQEKVIETTQTTQRRTRARNVDPELEEMNQSRPVDTSGYDFGD